MRAYTASRRGTWSGFSLIEVIIVVAILSLVFAGLFASFQYSLNLIAQSRSKMSALSVATDRMEYIRSLPFNQVGTVLGIPPGPIPQIRTVNLNGYNLRERVLIEWVDDPSDGLGPLDYNSITTDYKRVKLNYEWSVYNSSSTFSLVSTVVPRAIETNVGGGSVRVNVFNAAVQPLQGMSVRIFNPSSVPPVDQTRLTNPNGIALFAGFPAAADYNISVTSPGYTSDQTRSPSGILANPATLLVAVVNNGVTTLNFQIDRVSQLGLRFLSGRNFGNLLLTPANPAQIATSTNILAGADWRLTEVGGVYEPTGELWSTAFTPNPNLRWTNFSVSANKPAGTQVRVRFYTSTSTADIVPDLVLPGNSGGFTQALIDLSSVPVGVYPTLVARLVLETTNPSITPTVSEGEWNYLASETPAVGQGFTLRGNKTIGTEADLTPVLKFSSSTTTGTDGRVQFNNIEWDQYRIALSGGQVIREACPRHPFSISPNSSTTVEFLIGPGSAHNLRVQAQTALGAPVSGATVLLERPGFSTSGETGACGQVYFGSLVDSSDYDLRVGAPGYATTTQLGLTISGTNELVVTLNP